MRPSWKNNLSEPPSLTIAPSDTFNGDCAAVMGEALRRAEGKAWKALEWMLFDWRSDFASSNYEERIQAAVVDTLRFMLNDAEREAFDNGATEAEFQQLTFLVQQRHSLFTERLKAAA